MENQTITEIAKKLNVSTAMVSRVLRHCSGVDSEIRQRILQEAGKNIGPEYGDCDVYTICPDIPRYFWQPLQTGIAKTLRAAGVTYKMNVYTQASDEATVLRYLDEAESLQARVIILACHATEAICRRLNALANDRLILLVSEDHDLTNCFYVGSDTYRDGFAMGEYFVTHYAGHPLIMFTMPNDFNVAKRLEGFSAALDQADKSLLREVRRIRLDRYIFKNLKLLPSKLASLIAEAAPFHGRLCIYSPTGIPQFPLAIAKAKLANQSICLCQDYYIKDSDLQSSAPLITCNQDNYEQGTAAAALAVDFIRQGLYPEHKKTYIPSRFQELTPGGGTV